MLARSLGLLPRPRAILFRSYSTAKTQHIPEPQGSIVSHEAFLKAIGRGCEELGDKFKSWEHLFRATGKEMRYDLGIPTKQRRWILNWAEKYRDRQGMEPYAIPVKKKMTKKQKKATHGSVGVDRVIE
ncbi:MAG: IGR protein motif-domain-containing protein [Piptocephalis tieghemiana]|nr:MAG: IGR protein motif-domain-containing protein [Piptocephalis tieghemiana]